MATNWLLANNKPSTEIFMSKVAVEVEPVLTHDMCTYSVHIHTHTHSLSSLGWGEQLHTFTSVPDREHPPKNEHRYRYYDLKLAIQVITIWHKQGGKRINTQRNKQKEPHDIAGPAPHIPLNEKGGATRLSTTK